MSVNNTACSPTSTCTILDGATTNGTFYVHVYNPNAPVVDWRQKLELATICICNSLTCIVIIARLWYRWFHLKRFRGDDRWMALALLTMIGYTISQIGTNLNGSGLHFVNVPHDWRVLHWHYSLGWAGFWIVVSCIKMSVCFFFLELLNNHHKNLRYYTIALCALIFSLAVTMVFGWMFTCRPVLSNFLWNTLADSCVNYDIFRYLWIAVSVPIDIAIMSVPLRILKRASLRTHEKRVLRMVFCATLLGTMTCIIGIFSAFETRTANSNDGFWDEVPWIMMNDIEILMYALGASFPVLSKYIIQRNDPGLSAQHLNFTSWARHIPDFFTAQRTTQADDGNRPSQGPSTYAIELQSADKHPGKVSTTCDLGDNVTPAESLKSGPSEPYTIDDVDLEKGRVETNVEFLK